MVFDKEWFIHHQDKLLWLLNHPINVRSTVGRGSVFSITVPLGKASKLAM